MKATRLGEIAHLARLYWYTVEFGLIQSSGGLRVYGSGILSSKSESVHCLESPDPNRIAFDLLRVMRTEYRIDTFQQTYFVIDSFGQLFDATLPDFTPHYERLTSMPDLGAGEVLETDRLITPTL
jgi:phenylalanine-4-hydroxylase